MANAINGQYNFLVEDPVWAEEFAPNGQSSVCPTHWWWTRPTDNLQVHFFNSVTQYTAKDTGRKAFPKHPLHL